MTARPLALPFPLPNGPELNAAYKDLHLAAHGRKRRAAGAVASARGLGRSCHYRRWGISPRPENVAAICNDRVAFYHIYRDAACPSRAARIARS